MGDMRAITIPRVLASSGPGPDPASRLANPCRWGEVGVELRRIRTAFHYTPTDRPSAQSPHPHLMPPPPCFRTVVCLCCAAIPAHSTASLVSLVSFRRRTRGCFSASKYLPAGGVHAHARGRVHARGVGCMARRGGAHSLLKVWFSSCCRVVTIAYLERWQGGRR